MISDSFKKLMRRSVSVFLLLLMLVSMVCMSASAEEVFPSEPYDSYTYWSGPGGSTPSSTTPMYEFRAVVDGAGLGIGGFAEPADVSTDTNGNIYIADSGNGRVVIVDQNLNLVKTLSNLVYNGETLDMTGFSGIYVRSNGDIYICDTEHARIIICDFNGTVKKLLTLPEANVIPDDFEYRPTRVVVDSDGVTYVISDGSYYGAVMYDAQDNFNGFFGANTVQGGLLTVLNKIKDTFFRNEVKEQNTVKQLPYQFNDIAIDDDNFIYTATGALSTWESTTGQLRKLSPGGSNVLRNKTRKEVTTTDSFDFSDGRSVRYADNSGSYAWRVTDLRSMDVDNYGYMYAVCRNYGHVFIYDQDCRLLGVFGGGVGEGYQKGTLMSPDSIYFNKQNNDVLVVDRLGANITIYKETEFGALLKEAQSLTFSGAYEEAEPIWEKVVTMDRGCQLAYSGLSKAAYMAEDYEAAMEYAANSFDQDAYANAFSFVRNDFLSANFVWIFLLAIALVGGLIFFLVYTNKRQLVLIKHERTRVMFSTITHPFESFKKVKYDNKGSIIIALILLALYFLATVACDMYSGFMFVLFNKSTYNAIFVVLSTIGFAVLFAIVNWAMSTLFEGKGTFKQVLIVVCYSYLPTIFYLLFYTIFSNVFTPDEGLLLNVVYVVCTALRYIILCIGMMTIHEFGFFKFIGIVILTLIGMLIVVFVAFMVVILIQQMFSFIGTIIQEIRYR